jgi:hypothetical protein
MALAISVTSVNKVQRDFIVRGSIVASGSYVTGGDTLNFATATFRLGVDGIKSSSAPTSIAVWSQGGAAITAYFDYRPILGTTQANNLLQVFVGAGTEVGAGAYPAGVTSDTIEFEAYFPSV